MRKYIFSVIVLSLLVIGFFPLGSAQAKSPVVPKYQENFTKINLDNKWQYFPDGWQVIGRTIVMPDGSNQIAVPNIDGSNQWKNYIFSGKFKLNNAKEAGLLFWMQDMGNSADNQSGRYMQVFNANDGCGSTFYAIHKYPGNYGYGATNYISNPGSGEGCVHNSINPDVWHNFKIVIFGNSMRYYLDGTHLIYIQNFNNWCNNDNPDCDVSDEGMATGGGIGLKGSGTGGAQFDNLKVEPINFSTLFKLQMQNWFSRYLNF